MGRNAALIVLVLGVMTLGLPGAVRAQPGMTGAPLTPADLASPPIPGLTPAAMPGMAMGAAGHPAGQMGQMGQMGHAVHVVRPGETLDMIIARTLGPHPFRPAFVRDVFVKMNPQAFIQNNPNRLLAGAPLAIPDAGVLRDMAFPQLRAAEQAQQAQAQQAQAQQSQGRQGASGHDEPKRRWVRYP